MPEMPHIADGLLHYEGIHGKPLAYRGLSPAETGEKKLSEAFWKKSFGAKENPSEIDLESSSDKKVNSAETSLRRIRAAFSYENIDVKGINYYHFGMISRVAYLEAKNARLQAELDAERQKREVAEAKLIDEQQRREKAEAERDALRAQVGGTKGEEAERQWQNSSPPALPLPLPLPLPEQAPELYAHRPVDSETCEPETIIVFLRRVYKPWLETALLTRFDLHRLDPEAYAALVDWRRNNLNNPDNPLPPDLRLSPAEWYDERPIDPATGKREDVVAFLGRVWGSALDGTFTRALLGHLDPQAAQAVVNWLRTKPLPEHLKLPTRDERYDDIVRNEMAVRQARRLSSAARRRGL